MVDSKLIEPIIKVAGATVIATVVVGVLGYVTIKSLDNSYKTIQEDKDEIKKKKETINKRIVEVKAKVKKKAKEYDDIKIECEKINIELGNLKEEKINLIDELDKLKSQREIEIKKVINRT